MSHGCVNLQTDDAGWIAQLGTVDGIRHALLATAQRWPDLEVHDATQLC